MRTTGWHFTRLAWLFFLAGGLLAAILERRQIARVRAENRTLAEEGEQARVLAAENQNLPGLRAARKEADNHREDSLELLRLRNEVTQMRGKAADLPALRGENQRLGVAATNAAETPRPDLIPKPAWSNAGFGSPEDTLQTFFWSMAQGNLDRMVECVVEVPSMMRGGVSRELLRSKMVESAGAIQGYWIIKRRQISKDEVTLSILMMSLPDTSGEARAEPKTFRRVGNEWKMVMK